MRRFGLRAVLTGLGLLVVPAGPGAAQTPDALHHDGQPGAEIYVGAVVQRLSLSERAVRQTSLPVYARIPLGRRFAFALHTAGALTSGDDLDDLSGLADVQAALSGIVGLGSARLVLSLDAGLPTGTQRLDREEFQTLLLASQDQFAFATPVLGIGPSVSPGLTAAVPLSGSFVLGLGAAYRLRGGFEPVENLADPFEPGDETLLTAGFDVRPRPGLTASADVTYARYAPDVIDGETVFDAGDRVIASGRLLLQSGFHTIRLDARYRSRARNEIGAIGFLGGATETELPDQTEGRVAARLRANRRLYALIDGEIRRFSATRILPDVRTVLRLGAGIDLGVDDQIALPVRFGLVGGDLSGVDVSVGLRLTL